MILALIVFIILTVIFYSNHNHQVQISKLSKEEEFINKLFNLFGEHNGYNSELIRKPRTKKEWELCRKLCIEYGYDYDILFKHLKKPFFNYERYYPTYNANHGDGGTLILIPRQY